MNVADSVDADSLLTTLFVVMIFAIVPMDTTGNGKRALKVCFFFLLLFFLYPYSREFHAILKFIFNIDCTAFNYKLWLTKQP